MMDILERQIQARLIKRINKEMPDAVVLKTDPNYKQGFPDLLILRGKRWAALEVKREEHAPHRPNQDYWVQRLNRMSFARFIYPENEEEILHGIRQALGDRRTTRLPKSESVSLDQLHSGETERKILQRKSTRARNRAA
jgi:hypothetical protein